MILASLEVREGEDGNIYFFPSEHDFVSWKYIRGKTVVLPNAKVKVRVICYEYGYADSEKLLYAYLRGLKNGSVSTYRLD